MPDPLRRTISATEAAALFEVSPYCTRWMLYERFAHGLDLDVAPNSRMNWGKLLEPLVLEQAAKDLKFEIRPNKGVDGKQVYVRNGLLGCTRDAEIYCPDRGPGTCETKCVFDYRTWMTEWKGGNHVPRQNEIQVQVQMKVGAGETKPSAGDGVPYRWGVFAVWIAGEVFYFERKPVAKFWKALDEEASRFFDDVKSAREPEPFGIPVEYPLLNEMFPIEDERELDLRNDPKAMQAAEDVRQYDYHRRERLSHKKAEEALKARFRGTFKEHGKVLLPHGIILQLKQNKTDVGVKAHVPDNLPEGEIGYVQ